MKNEHASAVLDAYLEADRMPVPHAVLIEGPWGSGKTFFLKEIYEPDRQRKAKEQRVHRPPFLFVSLFGVKTVMDVEVRMYEAASPREVVIGKTIGTAITGALEALQVKEATKTTLNWIRKRAGDRHVDYVLVFDDLERVQKGAIGEVMGFVNLLVTSGKRRVLLVSDEAKLLELHANGNWAEQNEKIVGRRVRIEPDVESVVRLSVERVSDGATRTFMTDRLDALIDLASRSEVENLRNLSWAIFNGARFARSLLEDGAISPDHISRTMSVVVATTLWYRSKRLSGTALERLPGFSRTLMVRDLGRHGNLEIEEPETIAAKQFAETFAELAVESPPLEYSRIVRFEASGILDDADFAAWTRNQFGFGNERVEPAWRRVWHSYERPIAETETAVEELARELAEGTHTKRGTILHTAGLAIKHANAGDRRLTGGADVVPYFTAYVDRLYEAGTLMINVVAPLPFEYESSDGLGFVSKDTAEFAEVYRYLTGRQTQAYEATQKNRAVEIVEAAEAGDLEAVFQLNAINDELSRNPVLLAIDPDRMANLFSSDVPALNVGSKLLAYRYNSARPNDSLLAEIPWARQVHAAVLLKVDGWPEPHRSMSRDAFQGLIRHYEQGRLANDQIIPREEVGDGDSP